MRSHSLVNPGWECVWEIRISVFLVKYLRALILVCSEEQNKACKSMRAELETLKVHASVKYRTEKSVTSDTGTQQASLSISI